MGLPVAQPANSPTGTKRATPSWSLALTPPPSCRRPTGHSLLAVPGGFWFAPSLLQGRPQAGPFFYLVAEYGHTVLSFTWSPSAVIR